MDTGVVECVLPKPVWDALGLSPIGERVYVLPGGSERKMEFAAGIIELMDEVAGTNVLMGDDGAEPVLGRTVLLSLGLEVAPDGHSLVKFPRRLPGFRYVPG